MNTELELYFKAQQAEQARQRTEIRLLAAQGMSAGGIAKRLNISIVYTSAVVNNDFGYCWQCRERFTKYHQGHFCGPCADSRERNSGRRKAGSVIAKEVREGRLPPARTLTCVDCGVPAQQYDHRDYSKPLEVEPVCQRCNCKRGPGKWIQHTPFPELRKQMDGVPASSAGAPLAA